MKLHVIRCTFRDVHYEAEAEQAMVGSILDLLRIGGKLRTARVVHEDGRRTPARVWGTGAFPVDQELIWHLLVLVDNEVLRRVKEGATRTIRGQHIDLVCHHCEKRFESGEDTKLVSCKSIDAFDRDGALEATTEVHVTCPERAAA